MEFKHATSMLFSNMGYIFKILVWVIICLLITAAIGAAIIIPIGNSFGAQADISEQLGNIEADISDFLHGDLSIYDAVVSVKGTVFALISALVGHTGAFVGLIFALIFLYLLYSFLIGLNYYPTAYMVNNLMSSNLRFGFASALAANFKNACKYSAAKTLICFPIDIITVGIIIGLGFGLSEIIGLFALPIVLAVGLVLFSLRATLFSSWLPRLLFHPDEKTFTAFSRSLYCVKRNFKAMFRSYMITFFISYSLMAALLIPTFGVIVIVMPSIYYFLLRALELIGYYKLHGMCFYTDEMTVINTVEYGYRKDNQDEDGEYIDINY